MTTFRNIGTPMGTSRSDIEEMSSEENCAIAPSNTEVTEPSDVMIQVARLATRA